MAHEADAEPPGPLAGIRVIDFTSMMSGPFATRLLADCGADVVKVESAHGDHMRHRSPLRNGLSSYYGQMNTGKRSIALDLKQAAGRDIARRLIDTADVVIENYRPGVMKALGLDYASLQATHPRLIYCSISGFGQTGSRARNPAYAPIIHAASGLDIAQMRVNTHLALPQMTGIFTADVVAAIYAFSGIQTALYHRERTGAGQYVDVPLLNSVLSMLVYEFQEAQFPIEKNRPLYQPLHAKDGFVMVAPVNQNNFDNLCEALGHPEWRSDERFATIRAREHNWAQLMDLIQEWTIERSGAECEEILMRARVPCARYASVGELVDDPELRGDGSYVEVRDRSGAYLVPNTPMRFSASPAKSADWVAEVGEHRVEILRDILGLTDAEIAGLEADGILGHR